MTPVTQSPTTRGARRAASLRRQLDAALLVAILPIALVLGWQAWDGIRAQQIRIQDELDRSAAGLAQAADGELTSSVEALAVLSQSEIFQQGRIAAMGRLLHGRPRRDWDSVFLLDARGAVVLDTATHGGSVPSAALRELHAQALRQRGPVVSGVTGTPGIAIATPIAQAGHVRYVLGVRTSDAAWTRLAAAVPLPPNGLARLDDAQGRVIAGAKSEPDENTGYEASATVPLAGWTARVSIPAGPIDAAHRRTLVAALSTSGVSLALGLVLAALVARGVARRIEDEAHAQDERHAQLIREMRDALDEITATQDLEAAADRARALRATLDAKGRPDRRE